MVDHSLLHHLRKILRESTLELVVVMGVCGLTVSLAKSVDPLNPYNPAVTAASQGQDTQPPLATAPSDMPAPEPAPAPQLSTAQQIMKVVRSMSPGMQLADFAIDTYADPKKRWEQISQTGRGVAGGIQQVPH